MGFDSKSNSVLPIGGFFDLAIDDIPPSRLDRELEPDISFLNDRLAAGDVVVVVDYFRWGDFT